AKFNKDSAFIKRVNKEMLARGLVTRLWDVIHVAPPLVVTKEEIDQIVAGIDEALTIAETEVANELTA
ncbi:MAG TPA: aspartate aminotransferase family protein, partial [Thermomicrobiales bacterium]|nr:aspartate aminotransferase family protein [Thermomicrobiales bacterium]